MCQIWGEKICNLPESPKTNIFTLSSVAIFDDSVNRKHNVKARPEHPFLHFYWLKVTLRMFFL